MGLRTRPPFLAEGRLPPCLRSSVNSTLTDLEACFPARAAMPRGLLFFSANLGSWVYLVRVFGGHESIVIERIE
jgi:hypothetical protein